MLTAQLKAAPSESGSAITFPPTTARKRVLPNGLTVIVQEDRSAPVVSVQAWCGAGSIDENEHLGTGLSHILEHMLFKGTKTRSTNQIAQKIQDVGGYINAYTSFDRTVFWIDVPKDGVTTALDVLADAMMNSSLPPQEYQKEQEVIRREFAMGMDDPDRMAGLLLFATAYQRHPYRFPVIGDVRGSGLFLGVELVRDRATLEPATAEASFVVNRLRDRGVLIGTDGPYHNVLKIRPPMPFGLEDAGTLVEALEASLGEVDQ